MKRRRGRTGIPKFGHIRISRVRLHRLKVSPENEEIYAPVRSDDAEVIALAESIAQFGIQEPLIVTSDRYILSGHRRRCAASLAGLSSVPCRILKVARQGNPDFVRLLRECNRQRTKTLDEQIREEVISIDPNDAHQRLLSYRERASRIRVDTIHLREEKRRAKISPAKRPFLEAVQKIVDELRPYWPLSDRQIHYQLLNDPPLIHAQKPNSRYRNDAKSYKALSELLTRARHTHLIPYEVIADTTRPVTVWSVAKGPPEYLRDEVSGFLRDYARDLLQSQPNHIEIVGEKLTIASIIEPIASRFCIPITIGRGYCSTGPKSEIARRYKQSGKERLILLILSDFDPDGDEIAHSLTRSLRDDFKIATVDGVKVALTVEQITELGLPPTMMEAKRTSASYRRFLERYGNDEVYELEAVPPAALQRLLEERIRGVLDINAYNDEVEKEKADAAQLDVLRRRALNALGE